MASVIHAVSSVAFLLFLPTLPTSIHHKSEEADLSSDTSLSVSCTLLPAGLMTTAM